MTFVSLLGAFGLLFVAGWQLSKSYEEDEAFSSLVESSGKASHAWRSADEVLSRGRNLILAMDFFSNEPSGLFGFVERMLDDMQDSIISLKEDPAIPMDLARKIEKTFSDFNQTSFKVGAIAVTENRELFPQPNLERSSIEFLQAIEGLDSWLNHFLEEEKLKLNNAKKRSMIVRKDASSVIGLACVAYLLVVLALGYLIHKIFLNPVRRMADAADEALSERKSFTQSSLTTDANSRETASKVKKLFPKETGPKEIEILSKRLWQLVNKLEESVKERTKQLAERTEKLEMEIKNRKKLEADLHHAQKMEAVGQMATGIAHEIRTPAQFAGDHLSFVRSFVDELFQADVFSKHDFQDSSFLEKNVPLALDSIQKGLNQITEIISAMKRFSYKDTHSSPTPSDINSIIKDCVSITRNEWKNIASLESDYAADLPLVSCRLSEISQVLINLIVNSSHAIGAFHKGGMGEMLIKTKLEEDSGLVRISVKDNGGGIPEDARARVFEPFYTTKEVGVGTGQGLAISYNLIVERHNGEIYFDTTEGVGTTFHVLLPISPPVPLLTDEPEVELDDFAI
jgi:two-component system, NtrC family, sensor kinase